MKQLADRSPGLLLALTAVVVYSMIGVEILMYMVATSAFMFFTLGLGIVAALFIAHWLHELLSDGEEPDDVIAARAAMARSATAPRAAVAPAAVPVPRETAVPAAPRIPALPV